MPQRSQRLLQKRKNKFSNQRSAVAERQPFFAMMAFMNWIRAIGEGILFTLLLGLVSKKRPEKRTIVFVVVILLEIVNVVWLYAGQEESAFFFWHGYLVLFIVNIADYATYKRAFGRDAVAEKFFLWPLMIIPILSSFILTVGWLIKLYRWNFLELMNIEF